MSRPRLWGRVSASILVAAVIAAPLSATPVNAADSRDVSRTTETCPFSGRRVPDGTNVNRTAVAIKVDNTPGRNAQRGLERADVVVEQPVEAGLTRLTGIFHCKDAHAVGPVRSARADDPSVVAPFTPVLGYAGANDLVAEILESSDVVPVLEDGDALYRVAEQEAPFDLFADTSRVRRTAAIRVRPERSFRFGPLPRRLPRVSSLSMTFGGATTVGYDWVQGAWRRTQDGGPFLVDGHRSAVANVLIQEVDTNASTEIFDSLGNPSPEMSLEGSGRAFLFRDGSVIKGTWVADGGDVRFKRLDGSPMPFDVGQTWWELVPSGAGDVQGSIRF